VAEANRIGRGEAYRAAPRDDASILNYIARPMTTPQNPGVRRKQKARRTKQLAAWRVKNAETAAAKPAKAAAKKPS
jgi:hypothetical protein